MIDLTARGSLRRYAWLSIAAALVTIAMKGGAYLATGSVGLLSDALESLVNLAGAAIALWMLTVAAREPDEDHAYGHTKAEYFSSGAEGTLIVIAALAIAVAAVERLAYPKALERVSTGLAISLVASLVNLLVARILLAAGRRFESVTLTADGRHLMTDVWTSVGVLAGVAAVKLTGWPRLDPAIALFVAANITWSGVRIVHGAALGLLDTALPEPEREAVRDALQRRLPEGVQFHALRTRQSGARRFVSFHILVPGDWTVHRGHRLLERVEREIRRAIPNVTVFTHLESLDDPTSWDDETLDRPTTATSARRSPGSK